MVNTDVNVFQKALLDAVLEEYAAVEPISGPGPENYSVWIDREHQLIYRSRQDGCSQLLFLNQEKMEAYVRLLQMQGYSFP